MIVDACATEELFEAFARNEVAAPQRALLWAHAAKCGDCAARLQQIAVDDDAEVGTIIDTSAGERSDLHGIPRDPINYNRGENIGRYMVIDELGSGGLGLVYLAYDPDLDRRVAIKVLRGKASRSSDATLHQIRLMREAKAMARFSHPNIVTVHDVGVYRGEVFIAMEYVDGLGLRQWVSKHRPDWAGIRDVMLDAAVALEQAHAEGLVHRDFKPNNILVTDDAKVKVLDFGLARNIATRQDAEASMALDDVEYFANTGEFEAPEPLSRAAALDEPLTQSGQMMGTPGYMAPEQYDAHHLVDARSDQFAFCVTLHEMLYRRRPYRGRTFEEVRDATRNGVISPPREDIKIPPWLRAVILRGISTRPDDRFVSMEALRAALSPEEGRSRRRWIGAAAGFGASTILGAGVMFLWSPKPVPEEIQAVEALVAEARDAASESYYVYPPSEKPGRPTAYTKVLELEATEGAAAALADERASELRGTFADTLVRIGDRYWVQEGGKGFATDYYAAALIFDPKRRRAGERAVLTPGQLSDFERRAKERDFSDAELKAAGSLVALAEEDDERRIAKLQAHYEKHAPSVATANNLEALLGAQAAAQIVEAPTPKAPIVAAANVPLPQDEGVVLEEVGGAEAGDELPPAPSPDKAEAVESEKAKVARKAEAKKRASDGAKAFRSNQLDRAARLFHQALELDAGNRAALEGLANLEFERGRYSEALRYGRQAVRRSPKKGSLRILLGDAYYKTVNYPAARSEYEKASELGHKDAPKRLARLDRKQGK